MHSDKDNWNTYYFKQMELEKEMDKWFYGLTTNQQADFACNFWGELSFEDKKEEYYIE